MSEQKYEVELLDSVEGRFLLFDEFGMSNPFISEDINNEGYWKQYFTEQEIKDIDERYWEFAVPVEEEK